MPGCKIKELMQRGIDGNSPADGSKYTCDDCGQELEVSLIGATMHILLRGEEILKPGQCKDETMSNGFTVTVGDTTVLGKREQ